MKSSPFRSLCWALVLLPLNGLFAGTTVFLSAPMEDSMVAFAAAEIEDALSARGISFRIIAPGELVPDGATMVFMESGIDDSDTQYSLKPEGFRIRREDSIIHIQGSDMPGTLYGGLELAEIIRIGGLEAVKDTEQEPYMAMRGTKFNIPLDARSPSYSDASDAGQNNIGVMWEFSFWKDYIDSLARSRYNYISCWNLHPFPSLVRVPEYPDVALADVHRSTVNWREHYDLIGTGLDAPEILDNVEIIHHLSIEEKIAFWRKVMAYGKSRNVDFYFVTWNIFTNGVDGKYGITDSFENPVTRDYFRQSVKQMFLTYPDLKGIGLTTGENMPGAGFAEKEDWAFATYGQGILDAAADQPGRKMVLIHRQHMTGAKDIATRFQPVIDHPDVEFLFSFKYAKAHVYSSTVQTYHPGFVEDLEAMGDLKTIWTLRNDDAYYFQWAAPDFVRTFIRNIPYTVSEGYYLGSDNYIWGRDFLSRKTGSAPLIDIDRHRYHWLIWGRLGYNPDLGNERFIAILQARYPDVDAETLFTAWQEASMTYPKTTGFHWGALDFQWYIEGSFSRPDSARTPTGYHDVNRFISLPPHPGTDNIGIPEYVAAVLAETDPEGTTPLEVARQIHAHADRALERLDDLSRGGSPDLWRVLDDIRCMAWLGKHHASKIEAAVALALFRKTLAADDYRDAITRLQAAAGWWRHYASVALSNYHNPLWTNRVGHVDWKETFRSVLYDIEALGGEIDLPDMQPTPGGQILEAEAASFTKYAVSSDLAGYTGKGYVRLHHHNMPSPLFWTFEVSESGFYVVEFRYQKSRGGSSPLTVLVDGQEAAEVPLWSQGAGECWVWDRCRIYLAKGKRTMGIRFRGRIALDHVNILNIN
ncbi:MAG: carbohydrate-binding family 6 protein [Puniceicoccaceae bacterium]